MRCSSAVEFNDKGWPVSHECSHFYGRKSESTRFERDNADTMCHGCHQYFTSNPAEYSAWKLKQLGQKRFDTLLLQKNTPKKRDDKLIILLYKQVDTNKGEGGV